MLFDLPYELTLAIFKEWLDDLKAISALDVAFCNKAQRSALLDLISDDRDPTVPLDQFTESGFSNSTSEKMDDFGVSNIVDYWVWCNERSRPEKMLFVDSDYLDQVEEVDRSMFPILLPTVDTLNYNMTHFEKAYEDFSTLTAVLSCVPRLTAVNISAEVEESNFDAGIISALATLPNLPLKAFRMVPSQDPCVVTDLGICMLAQCFCKTLEELRLEEALITDKSINVIAKRCKKLKVLELNCEELSLTALLHLAAAVANTLWFISLNHFTCDDSDLKHLLQQFKLLEVIRIHDSAHITPMSLPMMLQIFPQAALVQVDGVKYACLASCGLLLEDNRPIASRAAMNVLQANHHKFKIEVELDLDLAPRYFSEILDAVSEEHVCVITMPVDAPYCASFPCPLMRRLGEKFGQKLTKLEIALDVDDVMLVECFNGMISHSPMLSILVLSKCHTLTDSCLIVIGHVCKELLDLTLKNALLITDQGMTELLRGTRKLESLYLADTPLIGAGTLDALVHFHAPLKSVYAIRTSNIDIEVAQEFKAKLTGFNPVVTFTDNSLWGRLVTV